MAGPLDELEKKFNELDADGSGYLDHQELQELLKVSNVTSRAKRRKALRLLDPDCNEHVRFADFVKWWNIDKENRWRTQKKQIKDAFNKLDSTKAGVLGKAQFGKLGQKACQMSGLAFDMEADWKVCTADMSLMKEIMSGNIQLDELQITYLTFERWYVASEMP